MSGSFKADKLKFGKPVVKDVMFLRKKPFVRDLVKQRRGWLTDFSGKHKVRLDWKLNDVAKEHGVFKITIDDKSVYVDIEELNFYTRIMFEK